MKKIVSITIVIAAALLFNGCVKAKKNVQDYFVKVKTVSAVVQDDGSVLVTGEIESEGEAAVENIGFSCGTTENHKLTSRQVDGSQNGNTFTAVFEDLSDDSTYYFKAFATNAYGYSRGNSISLSGITAAPVVPTCTLSTGYLNLGAFPAESNLNFLNFYNSLGVWEASGGTTFTSVNIRFLGQPKTKQYTTEANYTPSGPGYVFVSFNRGTISSSLNAGTPVYVNEISPGVFDVVICAGVWNYSSSTFQFKSHFTVSL